MDINDPIMQQVTLNAAAGLYCSTKVFSIEEGLNAVRNELSSQYFKNYILGYIKRSNEFEKI